MAKLWAVIRREYLETVRTKAFAISTVLVPLLMATMLFLPALLARSQPDAQLEVALLDRTGRLHEGLDRELSSDPEEDFLKDGRRRYTLAAVPADEASRVRYRMVRNENEETVPELEDRRAPGEILTRMEADILVDVGPEAVAGERGWSPFFYSTNVGDFQPVRRMERALSTVVVGLRLREEGAEIPSERLKALTRPVDLRTVKIGRDGGVGEREFFQEYLTALFFTIALYTSTLMSGVALSRGMLEEKANRVVEILVSSVTPFQLMTGKILGHAMVIASQVAAWSLMGAAVYLKGLGGEQTRQILATFNAPLIAWLGLYFGLGYLLYAAFFAGVGAVCTTEMEAQQAQTPLVLMQLLPLVIAMAVVRQPSGTMAVVLSMIPVFAPGVMMMRLALQAPPLPQLLASVALLVVSVGGAFWAVSRIFRVGILMTGKRMTLQEMMRWLRAA